MSGHIFNAPGPSLEGRDAAARVGHQLSVDLTHVDSDSAPQVDEFWTHRRMTFSHEMEKVQEEGPFCERERRTMRHGGLVRSFVQ